MMCLKGRLEGLEKKKKALEKSLATVDRQIEALEASICKPAPRRNAFREAPKARKPKKRIVQPSLSSVVSEVLREKKKRLKVNEIVKAVLEEKKYKTQSKNFKGQLRILLYKNERRLFRKAGPGLFTSRCRSELWNPDRRVAILDNSYDQMEWHTWKITLRHVVWNRVRSSSDSDECYSPCPHPCPRKMNIFFRDIRSSGVDPEYP